MSPVSAARTNAESYERHQIAGITVILNAAPVTHGFLEQAGVPFLCRDSSDGFKKAWAAFRCKRCRKSTLTQVTRVRTKSQRSCGCLPSGRRPKNDPFAKYEHKLEQREVDK